MTIIERVKQLNLPLDQLVVIGSGLLDALELRKANDIDLVLSAELFAQLVKQPEWHVAVKNVELVIRSSDTEAFLSWRRDGRPNFGELYNGATVIDGIHFANPQYVIDWKRMSASDKDLRDIALLEGYVG